MARPSDEGFREFYDQHRAGAFRTAFLITADREEARDITQEAFVRAFEHWPQLVEHDRPGAWLQTVVARLGVSWRRREALRRRRSPAGQEEQRFEPAEHEPALIRSLKALTPGQRAVVVLRFYADWSVDDVAKALGKRSGTVKALTAQGLSRLRPLLEAKGVRS